MFAGSLVVLLCIIAAFVSPAAAASWDAGDTVALLVGLTIGFICVCAGLGWYARREGYSSTA
jgi:hypothetical protein